MRDLVRHPLLVGVAVADRIDHARDAAETVQPPIGQVGHVRDTPKRQQMVRTDAVHRNAADDDHIAARILEAVAQRLGGIDVVAVQQAPLPKLAHALGRLARVRGIDLDAARLEQALDGQLESLRIERTDAPDAVAGRCPDRVVVVM